MGQLEGSRLTQARETVEALLEELELGSAPIMNAILKAKRLARLMRDDDAQTWLDLEARGYPEKFHFGKLGDCQKYARAGGRITSDDKYYYNSLPQFEADLEASRVTLRGMQFPTNVAPSVSSSNPNELTGIHLSNAVQQLTNAYTSTLGATKKSHSHNALLFNGIKSSLHNYATDCHHALSLSDAAETLFEKAREKVDKFVRAAAPKAADQMAAAFDRFETGEAEALTHALTSCRRLLQSLADAVFPAKKEPFVDSRGKSRKVGVEEYKNRLMAFFDHAIHSSTTSSLAQGEIELTASRLDALYEKACKGVHADVTVDEVRLVLISVYLILAEVVRLAETNQMNVNTPAQAEASDIDNKP